MLDSFRGADGRKRCGWCAADDLYIEYHDNEWGRTVTGDDAIFERISLEGFQAGLNWLMILKRREHLRNSFRNFQIGSVAQMTEQEIDLLMKDARLIRNRQKISSVVKNAKLLSKINLSISDFVWSFKPSTANSDFTRATSPESIELSKELKKLGLSFVGPTTVYAMMQSIGMVNDHHPECYLK